VDALHALGRLLRYIWRFLTFCPLAKYNLTRINANYAPANSNFTHINVN
jgi:hypothetical protein